MIPRFFFPVETRTGGAYMPTPRTVATFFTWADARDFVDAERRTRNLYMGEPRYDRRARGYRAAEKLTEITRDVAPQSGSERVAA